MHAFSYDGVIGNAVNKILDGICLSILWIVFSLPIFTMGAATTAVYYTVNKVFRNDEVGLFKFFWRSFKANLKQSIPVTLMFAVIYILFFVNGYFGYAFYESGEVPLGILIVMIVVAVIVMTWSCYIFPYMARFEDTTKATLKNCGYMMVRHFPWSLLLVALFVAAVVVFFMVPFGLVLAPGAWGWASNLVLEPIFAKYIPAEEPQAH